VNDQHTMRRAAATAAVLTVICLVLVVYLISNTLSMDPCERRGAEAHRVNGRVECVTDDARIVVP
jgi:hypothetical protein